MLLEDLRIGRELWAESSCTSVTFDAQDSSEKNYFLKKSRYPREKAFQKLIQRISKLSHPNLIVPLEVRVERSGKVIELYNWIDDDRLDLVSIRGKDYEQSIHIIRQLLDALALLHSEEIIHGDVRGTNVFVGSDLTTRLFDYSHSSEPYYLKKGIQTHHDVPPEFREGNCKIEFNFDTYQAGNLLKHLLFNYNYTKKELVPRCRLPKKIRFIVDKSMSELPDKRYQNAGEMMSDLENPN